MGGITSTGFHEKKFVFVNTPGRNTVETVSSNFPFAAIEILYLTVETKYFFFFFFLNIQKCFYESNIFRTMIKVTMLSLLKIYFDAICKEECIFEEIYLFFI